MKNGDKVRLAGYDISAHAYTGSETPPKSLWIVHNNSSHYLLLIGPMVFCGEKPYFDYECTVLDSFAYGMYEDGERTVELAYVLALTRMAVEAGRR